MSKIKLYTVDRVIQDDDKVIGTDFNGSVTKNYLMEDLLGYMQNNITDITVTGTRGPEGEPGPKGDPGAVGPAGLEWKGTWISGNNYVEDDAVAYDGASYFCIADATGRTENPDTDTAYWALLAAQGANGSTGSRGPRGYGIASSFGSFYDNLGNPIPESSADDTSQYKVKLTYDDDSVFYTGDLRGPKGDTGNVVGAGTLTSIGVDTNTPLRIADSGSNPITSSGVITMNPANGNNDGYLTSVDHLSFDSRIKGSSSSGGTTPTEIRVMTQAEYNNVSFSPVNNLIYVLI